MDSKNRYIDQQVDNMEIKSPCVFVVDITNANTDSSMLECINMFISSIYESLSSSRYGNIVEFGIIQSLGEGYNIVRDLALLTKGETAPTFSTNTTANSSVAALHEAIDMIYDRCQWYAHTKQKRHIPNIYIISTGIKGDKHHLRTLAERVQCDIFFKRYKIVGLDCSGAAMDAFADCKELLSTLLPMPGALFEYTFSIPRNNSSIPPLSSPKWERYDVPNRYADQAVPNMTPKRLCIFVIDGTAYNDGEITASVNAMLEGLYSQLQSAELNEALASSIEVGIIQAGKEPTILRSPALIDEDGDELPPKVEPTLCMPNNAAALQMAMDIIEKRKVWYRQSGQRYYMPLILFCSATNELCNNASLVQQLNDAHTQRKFSTIKVVTHPHLQPMEFSELFDAEISLNIEQIVHAIGNPLQAIDNKRRVAATDPGTANFSAFLSEFDI
ncbi:MAG: hypothetical protein IJX65_04910 [Alistipes sp.]|nr:hypothetical protein [Alistipes sp.]